MAYKQIYLEPDEEITSVIDKITNSDSTEIALVTAKNSGIFQSLVNLKLLSKESKKSKKKIVIVTSSKIGQKLAKQVGISTFAAIGSLPITSNEVAAPDEKTAADDVINGVKVKQYNPDRANQQSQEPKEASDKITENSDETSKEEPKKEFEPITVSPEKLSKDKSEKTSDKPEMKQVEKKEELPAVMSSSGGFSTHREFKVPWKSVGIGAGVLLFVLLLAFVFVPRAVVTITFPAQPITETVSVSAVVDLDNQQEGLISGNQLLSEKTKTKTVEATGEEDIGTKSTGEITVTNKYTDESGIGKDQTFLAGTKATDTKTNKVFTLNSAITIGKVTYDPNNGQPIYKSKKVSVTAVEPGESYNIAVSSFSIAGELSNTVVSSSAAFSGGKAEKVKVVTQGDIDTAILSLKKEAREEALTELTEKAQGQKIVESGVWEEIKQEGADKQVGARADSAVVTVIVEYGIIVFDEASSISIFTAAFNNKIDETNQVIFEEDKQPAFTVKDISADRRRLNMEITGTAFKVPKIDEGQIAKSVTNESIQKTEKILQDKYAAEKVETTISPSWWIDKLPFLKQYIRVEYGFNDTSSGGSTEESEG